MSHETTLFILQGEGNMNENVINKSQKAVILCGSESHDRAEALAQEALAVEYVKSRGWVVERIYTEFGSPEMRDRTSLRDFRRMAINKEFNVLVFRCLNIFGNVPDEVAEEVKFLTSNGITIVSLKDGEITSESLPNIFRKDFRIVK